MKRESNFEVLRVFAMIFIVVYHFCTHGIGSNTAYDLNSPLHLSNLIFTDLCLVISGTCVNLYVLISGYFLVCSSFKLSRITRTWFITCFYSFFITLFLYIANIYSFDATHLAKSLFPLSTDSYWFVTQFIGMLILSPLLSILANKLSCKQYIYLLIGMGIICLSIIPDFPLGKRFYVAHGNSLLSFIYLYFIAGFIRLHIKGISSRRLIFLIGMITIINLIWSFINGISDGNGHIYWFNYNAIPFLLSVSLFICIRQITLPENKFVTIFVKIAPYTFAVYLIHDHLLIRYYLWNVLPIKDYCYSIAFPILSLLICVVIFIICIGIDYCRQMLFKILKIDNLLTKTDNYSWLFPNEQL